MNRNSVIVALRKLEEATGWNLNKAIVKSLEIGATFPVDHSVSQYLSTWGVVPRFKKMTYQNHSLETVLYTTTNRSFQGYNKSNQAKDIPELFKGLNLIKLEMKFKKAFASYHGQISPWDITEIQKYKLLVENWKHFYFSIPKIKKPVINISDATSPKDLDLILKSLGANLLGDQYYSLISELETKGVFGATQATRARKSLNDLNKRKHILEAGKLERELDNKVISQTIFT